MAAKITRQPKNIVLLGAPSSAASLAAGHERGPEGLRGAGLAARLTAAGFEVTDAGDCSTRMFEPDDEHPRARNAGSAVKLLEELRPKVEAAVKSGALPIVLGGDDTAVLATIAGVRRYYRHVSLICLDRDAGLNVPATTPSGCLDGMVISHVMGKGAPELVRFWNNPPLVREPDIGIFGITRLDEPEQQYLTRSPLRRYLAEDISRMGAAAAAEEALARVHAQGHEFIVNLDLDVIAAEDFPATNLAVEGGLRLEGVRQALGIFARHPKLTALQISAYNPALDPDGSAARKLIEVLAEVLAPRLEPEPEPTPSEPEKTEEAAAEEGVPAASAAETSTEAPPAPEKEVVAEPAAGAAPPEAAPEAAVPAEPLPETPEAEPAIKPAAELVSDPAAEPAEPKPDSESSSS